MNGPSFLRSLVRDVLSEELNNLPGKVFVDGVQKLTGDYNQLAAGLEVEVVGTFQGVGPLPGPDAGFAAWTQLAEKLHAGVTDLGKSLSRTAQLRRMSITVNGAKSLIFAAETAYKNYPVDFGNVWEILTSFEELRRALNRIDRQVTRLLQLSDNYNHNLYQLLADGAERAVAILSTMASEAASSLAAIESRRNAAIESANGYAQQTQKYLDQGRNAEALGKAARDAVASSSSSLAKVREELQIVNAGIPQREKNRTANRLALERRTFMCNGEQKHTNPYDCDRTEAIEERAVRANLNKTIDRYDQELSRLYGRRSSLEKKIVILGEEIRLKTADAEKAELDRTLADRIASEHRSSCNEAFQNYRSLAAEEQAVEQRYIQIEKWARQLDGRLTEVRSMQALLEGN